MQEIETGLTVGVAPTVLLTELMDGSYDVLQRRFDGKKGELIDLDPYLANLARDVRRTVLRDKKPLETCDCIYIATAMTYECSALVTLDGIGNNRHNLLNAAPDIEKHFHVKVRLPQDVIGQLVLGMG